MRRFCARTMSRIVSTGKSSAQGSPVAGLISLGRSSPCSRRDVGADQEIALGIEHAAGPTSVFHHPGLPVIGAGRRQTGRRQAWQIRIALLRSGLSVP